MKRSIKFKGKRADNGLWIYGDFGYQYTHTECYAVIYDIDTMKWYAVHPDTVGQYIGENDKNGVGMYENDIFRHGDRVGKIIFEKGCFVFRAKSMAMTLRDHDPCKFEIIGNVFDNPELLDSLPDLSSKPRSPEEVFDKIDKNVVRKEDRKEYPDSVFWFNKAGDLIFEYDEASELFWCSDRNFWSIFQREYSLNHTSIQALVRKKIEGHFKLKNVTPDRDIRHFHHLVEEHFKLKNVAPWHANSSASPNVEGYFKTKQETTAIVQGKPHTPEDAFDEIVKDLVRKEDREKFPDSVFWLNKAGDFMFEFNEKTNDFWCAYNNFWSVFEKEYSLNYASIQALVRNKVEEHFKIKHATPSITRYSRRKEVEGHFKTIKPL